jgi:hypothetical protein
MSVMGRPKIQIDWDKLDQFCAYQATLREIAAWFKCSEDTIERLCHSEKGQTFAEYFSQKRTPGLLSLRSKMFNMAMNGDKTMLIWLSKQYLGMSEKIEAKTEDVTPERTITIELHRAEDQNQLGTKDATPTEIRRIES